MATVLREVLGNLELKYPPGAPGLTMPVTSFYAQQAANRPNSLLLAVAVTGLLGLLGFGIGVGLTGYVQGGVGVTVFALGLGTVMSLGSYFAGDALVLGVSGARQVDESSAPQLLNVVRELSLAAGLPKIGRAHV